MRLSAAEISQGIRWQHRCTPRARLNRDEGDLVRYLPADQFGEFGDGFEGRCRALQDEPQQAVPPLLLRLRRAGLGLQVALQRQRRKLIHEREHRVGDHGHHRRRRPAPQAHVHHPAPGDVDTVAVRRLEAVQAPALQRLVLAQLAAHLVPFLVRRRGIGDRIEERGECLLDAHPKGLAVRSVHRPRILRDLVPDLGDDLPGEVGQLRPHDRG